MFLLEMFVIVCMLYTLFRLIKGMVRFLRGDSKIPYIKEKTVVQATESDYLRLREMVDVDLVRDTKPFAKIIAKELEESLPLSYEANIFNRMMTEVNGNYDDVIRLIHEQKRFLMMTKVMKRVPMFSKDVDEVWHQMLMFTRSYESFCQSFAGEMIHHQPNLSGEDSPNIRFHFDLMYTLMFEETKKHSEKLWGHRFTEKPTQDYIDSLKEMNDQSMWKLFNLNSESSQEVAKKLMELIQEQIRESENKLNEPSFIETRDKMQRLRKIRRNESTDAAVFVTPAFVFWSASGTDSEYQSNLGYANSTTNSTTSSGCSSVNSCSSGGDSSCSSSGGSSCGGGCGGGCGS